MKIQSLHLENYRCFESLDIDLDKQLTVLVGVNGAGKTTVLDALGLFLDRYAHNFYSNANRNNIPQTDLRHDHVEAKLICKMCFDGEIIHPSVTLTRKVSNPTAHVDRKDETLLNLGSEKAVEGHPYAVVAYYSGKRKLDSITRNDTSQSALIYDGLAKSHCTEKSA